MSTRTRERQHTPSNEQPLDLQISYDFSRREQTRTFNNLKSRFDLLANGMNYQVESERLCEEMVRTQCIESHDWQDFFNLLVFCLESIQRKNKNMVASITLLAHLNRYLSEEPHLIKFIRSRADHRAVVSLASRVQPLINSKTMTSAVDLIPLPRRTYTALAISRFYSFIPNFENALGTLAARLKAQPKGEEFPVIMLSTRSGSGLLQENDPGFAAKRASDNYNADMAGTANEKLSYETIENWQSGDISLFSEAAEAYRLLSSPERPRSPKTVDIWTKKFGQHSLETLFEIEDMSEFSIHTLEYLTKAFHGNLITSSILRSLFFAYPYISKTDTESIMPNALQLEKVLFFQKWMAEQLFVETGSNVHPDFDQQFAELIKRLDNSFVYSLATVFRLSAAEFQKNSMLLVQPEPENEDAVYRQVFLSNRVVRAAVNHLPEAAQLNAMYKVDDETVRFMYSRLGQLKERFPNTPNMTLFQRSLTDSLSPKLEPKTAELRGEGFAEEMVKQLGVPFLENLQAQYAEVAEVLERILQEKACLPLNYLPNPGVVHTIQFSQGTFPQIIGLKSVSFVFPEDFLDPVRFHLLTPNPELNVVGLAEIRGGLQDISSNLYKTEYPVLGVIVEYIISASLLDLLIRQEAEANAHQNGGDAAILREMAEPVAVAPTKEHISVTSLPRKRIGERRHITSLGGSSSVMQDISESSELIDAVEKTTGTRISSVEPFSRFLESADLVRLYQADYETALAEDPRDEDKIARIRHDWLEVIQEHLAQPSEDKILFRPPGLDKVVVIDPETGLPLINPENGQEYFLKTWVKAHHRPAIDVPEGASLVERYERRYRAGSAVASLNELVNDLIAQYGLDQK